MKKYIVFTSLITIAYTHLISADPISKPLAIFESTKIPKRTAAEGPSIVGSILPESIVGKKKKIDTSKLSESEKKEYEAKEDMVKKFQKEAEQQRHNSALLVLEGAKLPPKKKTNEPDIFDMMFGK